MVGQVLSQYKIREEISRGGRGIVSHAVDVKIDRERVEEAGWKLSKLEVAS